MRLRNKNKEKSLYLENIDNTISAELNQIDLKEVFANNNSVQIEIGCGKGRFILSKATINPDINYIAVERELSVIGTALKRALKETENNIPKNLKYLNIDAKKLINLFKKNSIDAIYLNFSDPWPKKKHAKYRLTHKDFQEVYNYLLKENGELFIKTDNDNLFNYSLEEINNLGLFKIKEFTNDLYNSKFLKNNIQTEYEKKFVDIGKNISFIYAIKK